MRFKATAGPNKLIDSERAREYYRTMNIEKNNRQRSYGQQTTPANLSVTVSNDGNRAVASFDGNYNRPRDNGGVNDFRRIEKGREPFRNRGNWKQHSAPGRPPARAQANGRDNYYTPDKRKESQDHRFSARSDDYLTELPGRKRGRSLTPPRDSNLEFSPVESKRRREGEKEATFKERGRSVENTTDGNNIKSISSPPQSTKELELAEALPTQDYSYLDRVDVTSTTNGGEDLFSEEIIEETEEEGANLEKQDSAVPRKPNEWLQVGEDSSTFTKLNEKIEAYKNSKTRMLAVTGRSGFSGELKISPTFKASFSELKRTDTINFFYDTTCNNITDDDDVDMTRQLIGIVVPGRNDDQAAEFTKLEIDTSFTEVSETSLYNITGKICFNCRREYNPHSEMKTGPFFVPKNYENCCKNTLLYCPEPNGDEVDLVITHRSCGDGKASAWIVHYTDLLANGIEVESKKKFLEFSHGEEINLDALYNQVIDKDVLITDFSFPPSTILEIKKRCKSFILLDHHQTNLEEVKSEPNCYFDMNHAASFITAAYMEQTSDNYRRYIGAGVIPKLIFYAETRDMWWKDLEFEEEINLALFNDYWSYKNYSDLNDNETKFSKLIETGKHYLRIKKREISTKARFARKALFMNKYECMAINTDTSPSDLAHEVLARNPSAKMAMIWFNTFIEGKSTNKYRLRSRNEDEKSFNVATLAEVFGGGGHANAAGFTLPGNVSTEILFDDFGFDPIADSMEKL